MEKPELERLLAKDEEQLWEDIGRELDGGVDAFPRTGQEFVDSAKRWWKTTHETVAVKVCSSERVRKAVKESDGIEAITAVIDVISGMVTGVSVATAAALVVKLGITQMCQTRWQEKDAAAKTDQTAKSGN